MFAEGIRLLFSAKETETNAIRSSSCSTNKSLQTCAVREGRTAAVMQVMFGPTDKVQSGHFFKPDGTLFDSW